MVDEKNVVEWIEEKAEEAISKIEEIVEELVEEIEDAVEFVLTGGDEDEIDTDGEEDDDIELPSVPTADVTLTEEPAVVEQVNDAAPILGDATEIEANTAA